MLLTVTISGDSVFRWATCYAVGIRSKVDESGKTHVETPRISICLEAQVYHCYIATDQTG